MKTLHNTGWLALLSALCALHAASAAAPAEDAAPRKSIGIQGVVGVGSNPQRHQRLVISKSGVYENLLIDGEWVSGTLLKIRADNVVLRNCEIRNGQRDGITIGGKNIVIESCKIHHLLKGTYENQADAHGISGQAQGLVVRNCEIHHVSGDCMQFDPSRGAWRDVTVENCRLWTGPLAEDAAGFKKGERPGENALDTKAYKKHPRAQLLIRNCHLYGWKQPAQIDNVAALNLKENIQARVEHCLFQDNEICLRVRGDTGPRGGALVTIVDCYVYDSDVAVRMEDAIANLSISRLGVGAGVTRTVHQVGRGPWPGYANQDAFAAPSLADLRRRLVD